MAKKAIIARTIYENDYIDPGIICDPSESKVQQSAAQECDINYLMARYEKTGILPELIKAEPRYGDFSNVPDYQRSLEIVAHAETQFAALDAKVRRRFDDDPANFLAFCEEPSNVKELIAMGLATAPNPPGEGIPTPAGPTTGGGEKVAPSPSGDVSGQTK